MKDYEVLERRFANFSVVSPELYPEEKLEVKLNGEVVLEAGNDTSFSYPLSKYFLYPDSIKLVEVTTFYKGKKKIEKVFRDTLMYAKKRTVAISRTFPKGVTIKKLEPHSFVPMESADRKISLLDDSVFYEDTWVD